MRIHSSLAIVQVAVLLCQAFRYCFRLLPPFSYFVLLFLPFSYLSILFLTCSMPVVYLLFLRFFFSLKMISASRNGYGESCMSSYKGCEVLGNGFPASPLV